MLRGAEALPDELGQAVTPLCRVLLEHDKVVFEARALESLKGIVDDTMSGIRRGTFVIRMILGYVRLDSTVTLIMKLGCVWKIVTFGSALLRI